MSLTRLPVSIVSRFLPLAFLAGLVLFSTSSFQYQKVNAQAAVQACPTCRPPSQQVIYAPLIELKEASYTEINLNCRSAHPIDVVPTFYTDAGMPVAGSPIHLLPAEMRFVDVKSLMPAEYQNNHKWGGMSLAYTGNLMEVWGQLTLHGIGKKGSTNVLFAVVDAPRSTVSGAVWQMPKNATTTIALGNYSDAASSAVLTFSNGDSEIINLAPYQTEIINRKNNGQNQTNNVEAESVIINTSGQPGRVITTGLVVSNNGNFASSIRFYDTENVAQPNLYSTNFRLKETTPHIILKNTTANTITARPRFLPTAGEGSGVIELPAVTIMPKAVKELNLTSLVNAAKTRSDLDTVSVQIINSGDKGSLIGAANFTNNTTGIDYDIPLRDSGQQQRSAGGYPVRLDGDYSTILALTNAGTAAGKFTLQVNFDGGLYAMYPQELAPGATAVFDFRQLRDRQTPDSSGRVLPPNLTVGQIRWSMVGGSATTLIGRSEIISKSGKVSSSYSCGICCRNSFESGRLSPDQVFALLGDSRQLMGMQKDRDCYGNYFAEYAVNNITWSSSNTSVVDVSYNGTATALDVGDVQITGTWDTEFSFDNGSDTCDVIQSSTTQNAGMTVSPTITSITPNKAGVGSTTRVTINGSGFTFSPTFNAGSGITVTVRTVNSTGTQATADIAIAADASGGNHPVSVTVRGITSTSNGNFFVQIPTSVKVLSKGVYTGSNILPNGCPTSQPFGFRVRVLYQVLDQESTPTAITSTLPLRENLTNFLYDGQSGGADNNNTYVTSSGNTEANGQFTDEPVGICGTQTFNVGSFTQTLFTPISNDVSPTIRVNSWTTSGRNGCGNMTNGNDVTVTVSCQ